MPNSQSIGLGEMVISRDPQDVLVAYGLGSCVGIGMYDPTARVAGMVHAVLPEHMSGNGHTPGKFVDTGVPALLEGMVKAGAEKRRLIVWMAGGANMLLSPAMTKAFDIGNRNVQAALKILDTLNLRLSGQEVGGNIGRTVRLYVIEGRMTVRLVGQQEHDISMVASRV
jgi:chemotaxis protein CheD